ncbi:MAG: hypothetical protein QOH81_2786 [Sphingomonadales bacterium]|jgi:hypothetical protein|nr:hypothetical protein [Sphingomonadales bacterium]
MRPIFLGAFLGAATLALAGCATRPEAPAAPAPVPEAPPPPPAPPAPPPPQDWRDFALSPGDWTYRAEAAGSSASFGGAGPAFVLRCGAARQIVIERADAAAGTRLTLRTSFGDRIVAAGAPLPASDPLLDQMAFSRGRFTVAAEGLPMLVIPSWPEAARTIEDCRG